MPNSEPGPRSAIWHMYQHDTVQHPCMCGPQLNIVLLCDNLFLYFLYHLNHFCRTFYCSLVPALFVEHKLRNTVLLRLSKIV